MQNFFRNNKYSSFERNINEGDSFRGLPAIQFPWTIEEAKFKDPEHDEWQLKVICTAIKPENIGTKVDIDLILQANCLLTADKIRQMGFNVDRFDLLELEVENLINIKQELKIKIDLTKINEQAKLLLKKFETLLRQKYQPQAKKTLIQSKIGSSRVSRFSEN